MKRSAWIKFLFVLAPLAVWAEGGSVRGEPGIPRIIVLGPQRVLVVKAQGDPSVVAGPAYKSLFRMFQANAGKIEKRHAGAPMARWSLDQLESAKSLWRGEYAIPISKSFPAPPDGEIRAEVWEYGMVAEVLHIGAYSEETADIAALKSYIARNGFGIIGSYEEVYLKGPGMVFKRSERKYETLIRYRVERIGESAPPIAKKNEEKTSERP
ncbi:MAG: hypothetical protein ABIW76_24295 [Fibrobacteria bacterium]